MPGLARSRSYLLSLPVSPSPCNPGSARHRPYTRFCLEVPMASYPKVFDREGIPHSGRERCLHQLDAETRDLLYASVLLIVPILEGVLTALQSVPEHLRFFLCHGWNSPACRLEI